MFAPALLQIILATTALGVPTSQERHAQRVARRAAGPQVVDPVQGASHPSAIASENITNDVLTTNWAGAVLIAEPVSSLLQRESVC